jgi:saccharopine dehydrogenase-like NADP-dependent oxidoreductase
VDYLNILALGGCGDMGRMTVAILLESTKVKSITIADINVTLANAIVELTGSNKLKATQIDVSNRKELLELMSSHDIVINTVGPYYKFGKPILEAAIEAKKPYFDICDDWRPTLELLGLSDKAKDAGITAIIGMGASPGLTNLMAVLAYNELDEVDEIVTGWGIGKFKHNKKPRYYVTGKRLKEKLGPPPPLPNAALIHLFYESIDKIPTFKEGQLIDIEALTEAERLKFPGFKKKYVCHIGHPEPVTLPRTLKAKTISNLMYLGKTITKIVRKYAKMITTKEWTIEDAAIKLEKRENSFLALLLLLKEYIRSPPELIAIATGYKDKKRKKVAIGAYRGPYGIMAGITGVPLAVSVLMYMDGKISKKGVLTPEESIDPDIFFDMYAPYCGENLSGKDVLIKKIEEP